MRTIPVWNNLPSEIVNSKSVLEFILNYTNYGRTKDMTSLKFTNLLMYHNNRKRRQEKQRADGKNKPLVLNKFPDDYK